MGWHPQGSKFAKLDFYYIEASTDDELPPKKVADSKDYDLVDEASWESFPASDAPGWIWRESVKNQTVPPHRPSTASVSPRCLRRSW